jgi:hypothetical protein
MTNTGENMIKTISRVCMVVVVAGSTAAANAQATNQQGVLTSAVNDYTNDLDQSMSGTWNGNDGCADGCCADGNCGKDSCNTCGRDPGCLCDNLELFVALAARTFVSNSAVATASTTSTVAKMNPTTLAVNVKPSSPAVSTGAAMSVAVTTGVGVSSTTT